MGGLLKNVYVLGICLTFVGPSESLFQGFEKGYALVRSSGDEPI